MPRDGYQFEEEVLALLRNFESQHPGQVSVVFQPKIVLQTEGIRVPDIDLKISLPQENLLYFIELQDRERSSSDILHKIHYIRTKYQRKTFIFVYRDTISPSLSGELLREGVMVYSFSEFKAYISKYDSTLRMMAWVNRIPYPRDNGMTTEAPRN